MRHFSFIFESMKKRLFFSALLAISIFLSSCASIPNVGSRVLYLDDEITFHEEAVEVEVWAVFDRYNDDFYSKILFQLEIIDASKNLGCVLYDDGTEGNVAYYSRDGMNRRWDWGSVINDDGTEGSRYSFVIEPDGTGLYYDFSLASRAKPKALYNTRKIK